MQRKESANTGAQAGDSVAGMTSVVAIEIQGNERLKRCLGSKINRLGDWLDMRGTR